MGRKRIVNAITVCVLVSALSRPVSTFAAAKLAQEPFGTQFAYGFASPLLSVVHVPLKAALCGTTAVLSGLAYLLTFGSNYVVKDASDAVKAACAGPYIISPQRLWTQGESETPTEGSPWR
jgi:hypothetical protein